MILETGYNSSFEIRHEQYSISSGVNFTVLYLSDFHFNKFSAPVTQKIITTVNELRPDIILLGGDYVDTKKGLVYLNILLQSFAQHKNVFAVAGNHDYYFGLNKIKETMTSNAINWIEKDTIRFKLNNHSIQIDGNKPCIKKSDADFAILCLHKPINIKNFASNYHLSFAGHLHGGQFVFWQTSKGLYPGKLFYKWNILKATIAGCAYFISKGLGDTLPVRFNCPKDMIFVQVNNNTLL
ncbi:metallophosphoesterase [Ferruginibacter sp. SUN106]|uniref:metallophosphoesterase n=1 Tax=Ferruginibacter sp. SUN106 TaxID=2978348 RepID=UPI003D35E5AE